MGLKAIIFDVDGTLAETEELHRYTFNQAFKNNRLDWHWDGVLYKKLLKTAGTKERIKHYSHHFVDVGKQKEHTEAWLDRIHEEKTRLYAEVLKTSGITYRPGIKELIHDLVESGIRLAISTATSRVNTLNLLSVLEGSPKNQPFKVLATGDRVSKKKPDPEVYHLALNELGLKPKECIAIEDSRNGLLSAYRANIPVVITPSQYTLDENFEEASLVVHCTRDIEVQNPLPRNRTIFDSERLNINTLKQINRDSSILL